jgi:predicted O-methyltransferase YrrM
VKIRVVDSIEELKRHFGLPCDGELLEPDLDVVENDTEVNGRKRRDAEVLCTLAANAIHNVLELGTSHGRGAFKLASNLSHGLVCHTVNILPEQHDASGGKMVTHLIDKDAIGSYYRERGLKNVEQLYANTARWEIPAHIRKLGMVFVDAAHDEENVYLDSKLVWDRIAPGGFIVWHDFSQFSRRFDWIDASMRGVERFLRDQGLLDLEVVNLRHSWCGVLRKPQAVPARKPAPAPVAALQHPTRFDIGATLAAARAAAPVPFSAPAPAAAATNPAYGIPAGIDTRKLRYAIVYPYSSEARRLEEETFAANVRALGFDVETIGLPCPGGWWHFPKLDEKWRTRSADLMTMYTQLEERLRSKDVLISSGGPMLHPEFVRTLSTFNVWVCSDDPESSEVLSKPAAPAFDFAFPINIACLDDYRRWGCRNVEWIFPPVRPELCAPELTESSILHGPRNLDVVLLCERVFNLSDRAQRIEALVKEFPNAFVRGPGWPGGAVEAPPVYRRAKIGWNLHNSIGPCNTRTTMLPAFGMLEICDNRSHLGKIYELDREVVGFDTLAECVDKTRYYLAHDEERRRIAAAGWKRTLRDYTLERWWEKLTNTIAPEVARKLRPGNASTATATTAPDRRIPPAKTIESVLSKGITYCAQGDKLRHIAEAVEDVARRGVPGIYLEAGVALGGSATVIASAKPRSATLRLFDVFEMLPAPGEKDEPRAHEVYRQFLAGQRTAPIDLTYMDGIRNGMLRTVRRNMEDHGIDIAADHVEFHKGDFRDTLFVEEPIAFAHIDCDWYDAIRLCLERLADRVSPGGVLVFDDYKSFSGAAQAVDEWLARDPRFRLRKSAENVLVERMPDVPKSAVDPALLGLPVLRPDGEKPRVLMLVDKRGWAYDTAAQAISRRLSDEFEFRIEYVRENPDLNAWKFDLLYVFFWGEDYHRKFGVKPCRVIKEISSHRWENEDAYGRLNAAQAAAKYLADAGTLTATSHRLRDAFAPHREVFWCPNGFETGTFSARENRSGPLRIGWAGNRNDACKGVNDILVPAAGHDFELVLAGGDLDTAAMGRFYNSIDVLCVASTAEGEPLTLVEGMASGVFPVAVDVGIVPELVRHGENGFVVNRNPAAFGAAFQWCRQNVDRVRQAGSDNARRMATERRWDDVAPHWRRALRAAWRALPPEETASPIPAGAFHERNLGVDLGQWPDRARAAAAAVVSLPLPAGASVVDMGCGHQTLKVLLPASVRYEPIDRIARAPGVRIMDFAQELPAESHSVATFLGVFEYFADPDRLVRWAASHVRWLVMSFNDCSNPVRRAAQHWENPLGFPGLEDLFRSHGGRILSKTDLGRAEFLYVVEFPSASAPRIEVAEASPVRSDAGADATKPAFRRKTLALLSAAVNGDNSGDALIVDAVRRILGGHRLHELPLLQPLTSAQIEEINACDAAVICGTNLYQHVFNCPLTPAVISRIRVPILPLGVGSSAPIGRLPAMNPEGVQAVRMIHERCAVGSVRDPVALDFVRSLGIRNVELTGCPVLFHGLREPQFLEPSSERLVLSVRARLLHVEEHWNLKQMETLKRLCRDFRPVLLLQSPYDLPIAEDLVREFGLESLHDDNWGAGPMIQGVHLATRTAGFRLHFGMLSLAYGRPATFLATDTRTSGFCDMMGVPYHAVQTYRDADLLAEMAGPQPGRERFLANWRALCSAMNSLLKTNGLDSAL